MFAAFLLRYGLVAAIGVVAGIFIYNQFNEQREMPHERGPGGGDWRTSDFREPHDSWDDRSSSRARRERADRSRSSSTVRRRRRGKRDGCSSEAYSQKEMLTDELCAGLAECSICVDCIDARDEVFSCKKCYNIFHLRCIRKWASTCLSENGTHWTCPVCKAGNCRDPGLLVYTCMCGQTVKPTPRPGGTPHCCTKNCSQCNLPCHPGACD